MKISVTQEDIAMGRRMDICECPIALAMRRCGMEDPAVDGWVAYRSAHDSKGAALPDSARRFVQRFDGLESVSPFEFEVDL